MKLPLLAVVLAAALLPTNALAADSGPSLRRRFSQGTAAFEKGDFEGAVTAFADVYHGTGEAKHLWNLSLAEYRAGHAFDAWTHLKEYLGKPDANPANLARARTLLDELGPKLAHLEIDAPAGAAVLVDGASVGSAPVTALVDVDPAKAHAVTARNGSDEVTENVAPPGAATVPIRLVFPRHLTPAPAEAKAPAASPPPPAPSPSAHADASPAPPPSRFEDHPVATTSTPHRSTALRTWLTVGLGAGALAAAAGGVYMGMQSSSAADDASAKRAALPSGSWCANPGNAGCADLQSSLDAQSSNRTTSLVLFGAAGALAVGAVVSFLVVPTSTSSTQTAAAAPMLGPHLAGASWAGSF